MLELPYQTLWLDLKISLFSQQKHVYPSIFIPLFQLFKYSQTTLRVLYTDYFKSCNFSQTISHKRLSVLPIPYGWKGLGTFSAWDPLVERRRFPLQTDYFKPCSFSKQLHKHRLIHLVPPTENILIHVVAIRIPQAAVIWWKFVCQDNLAILIKKPNSSLKSINLSPISTNQTFQSSLIRRVSSFK